MPRLVSRTPMIALATLAAALALLVAPQQSSAYKTLGTKWPGGTVTYYNTVKGYDPAVTAAAKAWNKSGARVKFKRVSKKRARVKIRYMPDSSCRGLTRLPRAKVTRGATVYLPRPTAPAGCRDEFTLTIVAAHEFGHVLGLDHERRRCALMNPTGNRTGGSLCAEVGGTPPWLWRCRILDPDDVRGAIKIYGGKYRASKFTASPLCPLYGDPPPAPIVAVADSDSVPSSGVSNGIVVSLQRPADATVPPFLLEQFPGGVPFAYVAYQPGTCVAVGAAPIATATLHPWASIAVGQVGSATVGGGLTPGSYCVTAWAGDVIGRPSAPVVADVTIG